VIYRSERNSSDLESSDDVVPVVTFLTNGTVCSVCHYSLRGAHVGEIRRVMYTVNPKGTVDIDLTGFVIRMLCAQAV
jgi:hypothetical protein